MFEDAGAGHDESSYARLHGLYWLCANLAADAPLLVCVDDAQWADEPSLSFLGFLARRLEDLPVALVARHPPARRAGERGPARPGHRPRHAAPAPARADRRRRRPVGARGGRPGRRRRASAPPATRRPAATRSWSASCCTRCSTSSCARPTPRPPTVRELGPEAISTVVLQRLTGCRRPRRRWRARSRCWARAPSPALAAELAELDDADRRGGARGAHAAPTCSPATATGSTSCTRSCCRRSTTTCPCAPAARATGAPRGCCTRTARRRRRSPPSSR